MGKVTFSEAGIPSGKVNCVTMFRKCSVTTLNFAYIFCSFKPIDKIKSDLNFDWDFFTQEAAGTSSSGFSTCFQKDSCKFFAYRRTELKIEFLIWIPTEILASSEAKFFEKCLFEKLSSFTKSFFYEGGKFSADVRTISLENEIPVLL